MRPLTSGRLKALQGGSRAGGQALTLAADPTNRTILRGMAGRTVNMDGELYTLSEEGRELDGSDVEAGFRMALALVELPEELSGVCSLRIKLDERREGSPNGVTARIERGAVVSCEAGTEQDAEAWALGSLDGWLDTVIDPDAKAVRTGGDAWLTDALLSAIHHALFGARGR